MYLSGIAVLCALLVLTSAQPGEKFGGGHGGQDGGEPDDRIIIDFGGLKPGRCPEEEGGFGICGGVPCVGDGGCPGSDKCCQRSCGKMCMAIEGYEPEPFEPGMGGGGPANVVTHSGECPTSVGGSPICGGQTCGNDGDCFPDRKCCFSPACGGEQSVCMPAVQIQPVPYVPQHPGECPAMEGDTFCDAQSCSEDAECFFNEKCCPSECGFHCAPLIIVGPPPPPMIHGGECPPVEDEGFCENPSCNHDGDCEETDKCCVSSCGFHCTPALQIQPPAPRCPGDLAYNDYGSACEETCDDEQAPGCGITMPGCSCPAGTVRLTSGSTVCVTRQNCRSDVHGPDAVEPEGTEGPDVVPEVEPEPRQSGRDCPMDTVFNDCGTACELSCESPDPVPCTKQCVPGCFCPQGTMRTSLEEHTCVAVEDCPAEEEPEPTQSGQECPMDTVFNDCGTACELSCESPDPVPCTKQCVPGCFCPQGTMRTRLEEHTCVAVEDCPAVEPSARPCEDERRGKMQGQARPGQFVPQCTPDGFYAAKQCHSSTGYCWCADTQTGAVMSDTEGRFAEVDCSGEPRSFPDPAVLNTCPEGKMFADGVKKCIPIPEEVTADLVTAAAPAECSGDLIYMDCGTACESVCGEAQLKFCVFMCVQGCFCPSDKVRESRDSDRCVEYEACPPDVGSLCDADPTLCEEGTTCIDSADGYMCVQCNEGYTMDANNECVVAKRCPDMLAEVEADGILIGEFVPSCTTEGLYEVVQCWGSTGFCWCVEVESGVKVVGTDVRGTPVCAALPVLLEGTEPAPAIDLGTQEPPAEVQCPEGMVYNECASVCDPYCNQPKEIACITLCVSGCGCPEGTVKLSQDSEECVSEDQCPQDAATEPIEAPIPVVNVENTCPDGQVYEECGSACPSYCGQPGDALCIESCRSGCFCPEGLMLVDSDADMCIPVGDCPIIEPTCDGNMVFTECGTACPLVCNELPPQVCTYQCVIGCACPDGLYKDGDSCVSRENCPKPECPNGQEFSVCGTSCEPTCENPIPGICTSLCVTGCFCPSGMVKNGEECVMPDQCPEPEPVQDCPTILAASPDDLTDKLCAADYVFTIKVRSDGRVKILDDRKVLDSPYIAARPITSLDSADVCMVYLDTDERYFIFTSSANVDLQSKRKSITLDRTTLILPMTGHRKVELSKLLPSC